MVIHGTFISIWDNGSVSTPATLDLETGEVTTNSVVASDDLGTLMEEWFEDENGDEHEICPECHEYILHTCMEPGIGHNLDEVKRCKDPDCEYNRFVR
jgi:hypothetical protein